MKLTRVGLDSAKHVFQVHGVDARGQSRERKQLARAKVLEIFAQLPPCLIGMEASASSHDWGRELTKLGHMVKLIAARLRRELPGILEDAENGLRDLAREVLAGLLDPFHELVAIFDTDHALIR